MAGRFLVAAALFPLALAFSNTVPLVAWSSHRSNALDRLSANVDHSVSVLESILFNDDACDHDAVILINQPGLHASDLRALSPSSKLVRSLSSSPSSRQFQYVTPSAPADLASLVESVSTRCGARLVDFTPGQPGYFSQGSKHFFSINMPVLNKSGGSRKDGMAMSESRLADELEHLCSAFPKHVVIYTGSSDLEHQKRQSLDTIPVRPVFSSSHAPANTTLPEGGILKRYQLLTPGLITILLVVLFILLPMAMLGFSALASIQSPMRIEPPKGYNASERKSQ